MKAHRAAPRTLPRGTARENDRLVVLRGCLHFVQHLNSFIFTGTKCQSFHGKASLDRPSGGGI